MAVIENYSTEVGDVLVIKAEVPILGLVTLIDFVDDISPAETGTKYFTKTFRYSIDGITFSDWMDLTTENISGISVEPTYAFKIEYRYERSGSDATGNLAFNEIDLSGTYTDVSCGETYDKSIFKEFFDCTSLEVLEWCLNVLEKLYKPGIIAKYMTRGANENITWEDRDYIDFWRSITCFFSVIVNYARLFGNFTDYRRLVEAYLESNDMFFCTTTPLSDLIYIINNMYDEMRKRGTLQVALKTNISDNSDSLSESESELLREIDGEMYRLVCYEAGDEFIYALSEPQKCGWVVGRSSPLYRGINFRYNTNKSYENSSNIISLDNYPILKSFYVSVGNDDSRNVIKMSPTSLLDEVGIKSSEFDINYAIPVSPNVDYEITFFVKNTGGNNLLSFGVDSYTVDGNAISNVRITGATSNHFIFYLSVGEISSKYYLIRGILKNQNKTVTGSDEYSSDGFSRVLKFANETVSYIIPFITAFNVGDSNEFYVHDVKIRPIKTDFSLGSVSGSKYYLLSWLDNKNPSLTNDAVERSMKEKLVPYNAVVLNTFV